MKNIKPLIRYMESIKNVAERQMQYECNKYDELLIASYVDDVLNCDDIIKILHEYGNGTALQSNSKKCPGCGEMFSPKNQAQEVCSGKCRVRMHRNKNRLKDFNQKVGEILRAKDPEAKFTVEQLMVENGKCPFVVTYQGTTYKADNTKSLLLKIKKGS